jgi:hypothetical protein
MVNIMITSGLRLRRALLQELQLGVSTLINRSNLRVACDDLILVSGTGKGQVFIVLVNERERTLRQPHPFTATSRRKCEASFIQR